MKIPTLGEDGQPNGWVLPIWNANTQPDMRPDQVYVTAVAPHRQKGPHLHKIRRGVFCCIKGNVRIVIRHAQGDEYQTFESGEAHDYLWLEVPPGVVACIYNDGDEEALVLNLPSPAWSPDAQDENPVENWNP